MRLLNTRTYEFKEFFDADIPKYAILSHRWSTEEVSYQDFLRRKNLRYAGYEKIRAFCEKASDWEIEWGWVDTCCIDKSSSAELSEAINSMFRWYEAAEICFVYLSDLHSDPNGDVDGGTTFKRTFMASQWFTRGWTLQELIAPSNVRFYNADWRYVGDKMVLSTSLALRTGISPGYLAKRVKLREACVAEKMSWAAHRKTSRYEDIAYCLLGIFDIQMPLLYGEGRKAFSRLQEEIVRKSDDESVFAYSTETSLWETILDTNPHLQLGKLGSNGWWSSELAADPLPSTPDTYSPNDVFSLIFNFSLPGHHKALIRNAYSVTNKGIHMEIRYHKLDDGTWLVPLSCKYKDTNQPYYMLLSGNPFSMAPEAQVRINLPQSWIQEQLIKMDLFYGGIMTLKTATVYLTSPPPNR